MNNIKRAIYYGRELFLAGINNGANGNLSFRQGKNILITRSGALLSELSAGDFVFIDHSQSSSERLAHQIMYADQNIAAVLHVHSISAIAWSLRTKVNWLIPEDLEGRHHFPKIPIIKTELIAGARDLPDKLYRLREYKAVIVRGHGIFVFGQDMKQCYTRACTVDNICRILIQRL